jgi:hypothetical protein
MITQHQLNVEIQKIRNARIRVENLVNSLFAIIETLPTLTSQTITGDGSTTEFTILNIGTDSAVVLLDGTTYEQIYGSIRYSGTSLIINTGSPLSLGQTIKVIIIKKQV